MAKLTALVVALGDTVADAAQHPAAALLAAVVGTRSPALGLVTLGLLADGGDLVAAAAQGDLVAATAVVLVAATAALAERGAR